MDEPQLLQLRYRHDPWKMMVVCCLLNRTTGVKVEEVLGALFSSWSDAASMASADDRLEACLRPLGMHRRRADLLRRMADAKLDGLEMAKWPGVGSYAIQSYLLFCEDAFEELEGVVTDKELTRWMRWRRGGDSRR